MHDVTSNQQLLYCRLEIPTEAQIYERVRIGSNQGLVKTGNVHNERMLSQTVNNSFKKCYGMAEEGS